MQVYRIQRFQTAELHKNVVGLKQVSLALFRLRWRHPRFGAIRGRTDHRFGGQLTRPQLIIDASQVADDAILKIINNKQGHEAKNGQPPIDDIFQVV